jgi:hypothetical protein
MKADDKAKTRYFAHAENGLFSDNGAYCVALNDATGAVRFLWADREQHSQSYNRSRVLDLVDRGTWAEIPNPFAEPAQ